MCIGSRYTRFSNFKVKILIRIIEFTSLLIIQLHHLKMRLRNLAIQVLVALMQFVPKRTEQVHVRAYLTTMVIRTVVAVLNALQIQTACL